MQPLSLQVQSTHVRQRHLITTHQRFQVKLQLLLAFFLPFGPEESVQDKWHRRFIGCSSVLLAECRPCHPTSSVKALKVLMPTMKSDPLRRCKLSECLSCQGRERYYSLCQLPDASALPLGRVMQKVVFEFS